MTNPFETITVQVNKDLRHAYSLPTPGSCEIQVDHSGTLVIQFHEKILGMFQTIGLDDVEKMPPGYLPTEVFYAAGNWVAMVRQPHSVDTPDTLVT